MLQATTSRPALADEGTISATTSRMTDDEATKWLTKSFEIFSEIAEAYESAPAQPSFAATGAAVAIPVDDPISVGDECYLNRHRSQVRDLG